jgi:hypothetical protein
MNQDALFYAGLFDGAERAQLTFPVGLRFAFTYA